MSSARIVAVCRVHQLLPDAGSVGVTAIDKRPVAGPVAVRRLGLYGDVQADRANHGGEDKAVYAYSEDDAAAWARTLGRAVPPGYFGENLRVDGVSASRAVIGERWRFAGGTVLEVTMPRIPCATFGRHLGEKQWVRRFMAEGRPGAYLRVLAKGTVEAGEHFDVEHVPGHGVRVGEWMAAPTPAMADALLSAHAAEDVRLADELREYVDRTLARSS